MSMQPKIPTTRSQTVETNEIDLMVLFGALLDRKWFIAIVTAIFLSLIHI